MTLDQEARRILKRILDFLSKHITDRETPDGEGYLAYNPWNAPGGEGSFDWGNFMLDGYGIIQVDRWYEAVIRRQGKHYVGHIRMIHKAPAGGETRELNFVAHNLRDALARIWMEGVLLKREVLNCEV